MTNNVSGFDRFYRSCLGRGMFPRGFGNVHALRTLLEFYHVMTKRDKIQSLITNLPNLAIKKAVVERHYHVYYGMMFSPLAEHCPELLPEPSKFCKFQLITPTYYKSSDRPVSIHMAGTGDQTFSRRKHLLGIPLATEDGIASLLIENPFYGSRKPKEQIRSNVRYVSDIFVMGAGLMLEGLVMLKWLEQAGYGPFCLTGISMGGHMASLCAANYPKPIGIAPCLSWSTASPVFTRGVMTNAINWEVCDSQFKEEAYFSQQVFPQLQHYEPIAQVQDGSEIAETRSRFPLPQWLVQLYNLIIVKLKKFISLSLYIRPSVGNKEMRNENSIKLSSDDQKKRHGNKADLPELSLYDCHKGPITKSRELSREYMRRLMDHFTHLNNFDKPVDPELAYIVAAKYDGYVLRDGVSPMQEVWKGCTVRYLNRGHVTGYVTGQNHFRRAIRDSINKHREKYTTNGTPRTSL